MIYTCKQCKQEFKAPPSDNSKFCKKLCYTKYQSEVGYSHAYQKGHTTANKGENHHNWGGESVGYSGVHKWVYKQMGQPSICDECHRTDQPKYEWANISREYKRDLTDWRRLCKKCHQRYDDVGRRVWEARFANGTATGYTTPAKTHCKRGHEYSSTNAYVYKGNNFCRLCRKIREEKYEDAKRS